VTLAAVSYVFTLARVAKMLGEDEELLRRIAEDMEPEDGRLSVLGCECRLNTPQMCRLNFPQVSGA